MRFEVADRLAATGSSDMELAWRWTQYFDWGNQGFQRILQNTKCLRIERRVKSTVCRGPCEGEAGGRVVALSFVDGMEDIVAMFRRDRPIGGVGKPVEGCINDIWTLQVTDESPFSTVVGNVGRRIREVLMY